MTTERWITHKKSIRWQCCIFHSISWRVCSIYWKGLGLFLVMARMYVPFLIDAHCNLKPDVYLCTCQGMRWKTQEKKESVLQISPYMLCRTESFIIDIGKMNSYPSYSSGEFACPYLYMLRFENRYLSFRFTCIIFQLPGDRWIKIHIYPGWKSHLRRTQPWPTQEDKRAWWANHTRRKPHVACTENEMHDKGVRSPAWSHVSCFQNVMFFVVWLLLVNGFLGYYWLSCGPHKSCKRCMRTCCSPHIFFALKTQCLTYMLDLTLLCACLILHLYITTYMMGMVMILQDIIELYWMPYKYKRKDIPIQKMDCIFR